MRSLLFVVLLCVVSSVQGFTANGTSFSVSEKSAYCYYYSSGDVSVSNTNTWINATSNNLYGYVSVYASNSDKLSATSTTLAICTPNQGNHNYCTTESIEFTYAESIRTEYIFVCMECHFWFGPCIFDSYFVSLSQPATSGYVDCSFCR